MGLVKLVLFDIDGTLLQTGGAGGLALSKAMRECYGLSAGMDGIQPYGKTDPLIVREVLSTQLPDRVESEPTPEFFACYLRHFRLEIQRSKNFAVLPGARRLLDRLRDHEGFLLGIETGNIEPAAQLKLRRARMEHYFHFGGFGSDSEDRTRLIQVAVERGAELIAPKRVNSTCVIGDTPQDVFHGKRAGARTIGVASSVYNMDTLRSCHPDLTVPSLTALDQILSFLDR